MKQRKALLSSFHANTNCIRYLKNHGISLLEKKMSFHAYIWKILH